MSESAARSVAPSRVLVVAPNWLGDAVMALPAVADVRKHFPSAMLTVAARRPVVELFPLVPSIDRVVTLEWRGRWWQRAPLTQDVARLRNVDADLAILLPNSFAAAWLVKQAGVRERWGYAADLRSPLLSRAIRRPPGSRHQGAYYQYLTRELGIDGGPLEPVLTVSDDAVASARELLIARGWRSSRPLVVFAPGAAYGHAKRWKPAYVRELVADLVRQRSATCVLVGSGGDIPTAAEVLAAVPSDAAAHVVDLTGRTTIEMLAGVLAVADACVSNDSGAMHMAAAVGAPVVALFGPTNEYETAPLTREGRRRVIVTHDVWCRPCMLRECPIDHRCMKGITPDRVRAAVEAVMESNPAANRLNALSRPITRGQTPGQGRGQTPGQSPGQSPGQTPGQSPGQSPGQTPGQTLGQGRGQTLV